MNVAEQAELVRAGEVSARELVEESLETIERLRPSVNVFSFVAAERALEEADRVRAGDPRPLCGVPLAVKDLLGATNGLPSTHGTAAFGDWIAGHDDTCGASAKRVRSSSARRRRPSSGCGPSRSRRARHHAQPTQPRACCGRLVRRQRCGGRSRQVRPSTRSSRPGVRELNTEGDAVVRLVQRKRDRGLGLAAQLEGEVS